MSERTIMVLVCLSILIGESVIVAVVVNQMRNLWIFQ
jgi:hypothetical protein